MYIPTLVQPFDSSHFDVIRPRCYKDESNTNDVSFTSKFLGGLAILEKSLIKCL